MQARRIVFLTPTQGASPPARKALCMKVLSRFPLMPIILCLLLCLPLCLPLPVLAESLYFPSLTGTASLRLNNPTNTEKLAWIQIKSQSTLEEVPLRLPAKESLILHESDFLKEGLEYSIKIQSPQIMVFRDLESGGSMKGSNQTNPSVRFFVPRVFGSLTLAVLNQSYASQKIWLHYFNRRHQLLGSEVIQSRNYFQTSIHPLKAPLDTNSLELEGMGRLQARLLNQNRWQEGLEMGPVRVEAPESQTYFLVSNRDLSDSYVIALTDASTIQRAREVIQSKRELIVFAKIAPTEKSWNRPLTGNSRVPWSWKVTEVTNFADFGSIACDGSPSQVEENLPQWMNQGRICFWSFRLLRELTAKEVSQGRLSI